MTVRKVIFMGSPAFAVPSLRAVHAAFEIVAVYSQPPRPAGRGQQLQKTPVHLAAEELGLEVRTPEKLRGEDLEALLAVACDAVCVVAYGLLLPKRLVDSRLCLNVHPSALPRWRGAAPLQWTLLAGDDRTEVCIMQLNEGMDTGPVFTRMPLAVQEDMTLGALHDVCARTGAGALVDVLNALPGIEAVPQTGEASHARKLTAEDRKIDWNWPAAKVHDRIRGLSPAPGACFAFGDEVVKVLRSEESGPGMKDVAPGTVVAVGAEGIVVVCGDGRVVRLLEIQRPGKRALPVAEVVQGWDIKPGDVLA